MHLGSQWFVKPCWMQRLDGFHKSLVRHGHQIRFGVVGRLGCSGRVGGVKILDAGVWDLSMGKAWMII
jgi:hypothetical protein